MDYFKILNLEREPFSNSPEPDFFFQSEQHWSCLQKLELAVRLRRGLNVVMGEVGTGKTTLGRQLILKFSQDDEDRERIETHLILDPSFSNTKEFLMAVTRLLGVGMAEEGPTEWQIKENIKNYLYRRGVDEGKIVLIIIDEGQKLPDFCLEILREFLNYETNECKLLQIIIFAQKEFEDLLQLYTNFADRVNQYYFLEPFRFRDTGKMIKYRIERASADPEAAPKLFSFPALWAVHRATGGYPRKIITLCHQVLLTMIIQNRKKADFSLVRSCGGRVSKKEAAHWPRWLLAAGALAVLMFLIIRYYAPRDLVIFFSDKRAIEDTVREHSVIVPAPEKANNIREEPAEATYAQAEARPSPEMEDGLNESRTPVSVGPIRKINAAPLKTKPEILGELTIKNNDFVLRMLQRIYGKGALFELDSVALANPKIRDLNLVKNGDVIKIPARQKASNPLPKGKYRVKIESFGSLKDAYDYVIKSEETKRLLLVPYWNEGEGTVFEVLLPEGFDDELAAVSALDGLPPFLAAHAQVVREWDKGTVFL